MGVNVRVSVGIDFGTSTTLISVRQGEAAPGAIQLGRGRDVSYMPSVVVAERDNVIVGEGAEEIGPPRAIYSVKSALSDNNDSVGETGLTTRDLIEAVLREAIRRAEEMVPGIQSIPSVFIGCPAQWDGHQRRVLADIAHDLGIDVDLAEVIDEPVAAGLAWVEEQWTFGSKPKGKVVIFDAGGGTLDVAILKVEGTRSGRHTMTVLAADSIRKSGDAIDDSIAAHIAEKLGLKNLDPNYDSSKDRPLLLLARELKEQLSVVDTATVTGRSSVTRDQLHTVSLTNDELERIVSKQVDTSISLLVASLRTSLYRGNPPLSPSRANRVTDKTLYNEVNHVVLVGGMSRLKAFRKRFNQMFTNAEIHQVANPQEMVCLGLTYGDRLQSLNLPRPPVNFVLRDGSKQSTIYQAFTPLYYWSDPILKDELFRQSYFPPQFAGSTSVLECVSPTRDQRKLELTFAVRHDADQNVRSYMWWDPNDEWQQVDQSEIPNEVDVWSFVDIREGKREIDEETGFVDLVDVRRSLQRYQPDELTVFIGKRFVLPQIMPRGFVKFNVDGNVLIDTNGGYLGGKAVKFRILYWPLKAKK